MFSSAQLAHSGYSGKQTPTIMTTVLTNTSGQVRVEGDSSDSNTLSEVVTHGWYDFRGKEG